MINVLPIPHFQQSSDGYCLSACARMVLAYQGLEYSEVEISHALGAQDFGTPHFAIQRLTQLELYVIYRDWSVPALMSALGTGQPVIAFVRTGFLDYCYEDFAHAVVIVGISPEQQFWIHDPTQPMGPQSVSWNGFLAAWAEFGYRGAALKQQQNR